MVSVTGSGSYLNKNFVIFWHLCCHLVSVPKNPADLLLVISSHLAVDRRSITSTLILQVDRQSAVRTSHFY